MHERRKDIIDYLVRIKISTYSVLLDNYYTNNLIIRRNFKMTYIIFYI